MVVPAFINATGHVGQLQVRGLELSKHFELFFWYLGTFFSGEFGHFWVNVCLLS